MRYCSHFTAWHMFVICDHYFVPALEILCDELKIPPNVAGATFMAIGTSAPDVFVSIFGLFVTKSSIGIGTIVGSSIFNHMCICAACVMNSPEGKIRLNPKILTREAVAYLVALILLVFALRSDIEQKDTIKKSKWKSCLTVSWLDALVLILWYGVYVGVAANYEILCIWICGSSSTPSNIEIEREVMNETPISNPLRSRSDSDTEMINLNSSHPIKSDIHERNAIDNSDHLFTNDSNGTPNRATIFNGSPISQRYKKIEAEVHDCNDDNKVASTDVKRILPPNSCDHTILCTSSEDSDDVETAVERPSHPPSGLAIISTDFSPAHSMSMPLLAHTALKVWEYSMFPVRISIMQSIPNIKTPETRRKYGIAVFVCILWLGLLAEGIVECIQILGDMMGVSQSLMGLTVSSVGASLPSIWSSMIASRQGQNDMAISNALGANTFSIMVGLGMPWLIYTVSFSKNYNGIEDDGIVVLIIMLAVVLVAFYVLVWWNHWTIDYW